MQGVDTIVVPLDRSELAESALALAAVLSGATGVRVELLTIVEVDSEVPILREYLTALLPAAGQSATVVEPIVHEAPAEALADYAAATPGRMLCLSSRGRSGIGRTLFGSTAEDTLRRLAAPAWIVGPSFDATAWRADGAVVVLLDGSSLAETIVPTADEWAQALGCALRVATAAPLDAGPDEYVRDVAVNLSAQGSQVADVTLHHDDPVDAIITYALQGGVAAFAMTTHGRTGLERLTTGSVAMGVVAKSPAPVLLLRPAEDTQASAVPSED